MRTHCLFVAVALLAVGCAENTPIDRIHILVPGREMRLACHYEVQMDGASTSMEMAGDRVVKREETPYASTESADMDLPLSVAAIAGSQNLRVTMTVQRFRNGNSSFPKGGERHEGFSEFEAGPSTGPASEMDSLFRDAEFIAVVDPVGRLISSDATGSYWDKLKHGASKAQADMAIKWEIPGMFAALDDATAYLPPKEVQPGQKWKVVRQHVYPMEGLGFVMLTNGCSRLTEESTCTLKATNVRGQNRIAIIGIRGQRIPLDRDPRMPERVKRFELTGELEVNLSTGAVEKLHLGYAPTWARPQNEDFTMKFVETISLTPK